MATKRDNFTQTVIKPLKDRVALRCSNPACRVPTSASSVTKKDGVTSIGVAAHICAAATGGPRYDPDMTSEQRKSIDNAIWLCASCSVKIDRDVNLYSKEELHKWKQAAEEQSVQEIGKKLPNNIDTLDQVAMALTGFPKKNILVNAISNTHLAVVQSLAALDPRFGIQSSYVNGVTKLEIFAKEPLSLDLQITPTSPDEFRKGISSLVNHGGEKSFSIQSLNVQGSRLFDEIFPTSCASQIVLKSHLNSPARLKFFFLNSDGSPRFFDNFDGEVTYGKETFTFVGSACNGMLKFILREVKPLADRLENNGFELYVDLEPWNNQDIKYLKYFGSIYEFFKSLNNGCNCEAELEFDGLFIAKMSGHINLGTLMQDIATLLLYTKYCQIISKSVDLAINFISTHGFTAEEHEHLAWISRIFEGKEVATELENNLKSNLQITDLSANELINMQPSSVKICERLGQSIYLFGQEVLLPPKVVEMDSVVLIPVQEKSHYDVGEYIEVEYVPQKDFLYKVSFDSSNNISNDEFSGLPTLA